MFILCTFLYCITNTREEEHFDSLICHYNKRLFDFVYIYHMANNIMDYGLHPLAHIIPFMQLFRNKMTLFMKFIYLEIFSSRDIFIYSKHHGVHYLYLRWFDEPEMRR